MPKSRKEGALNHTKRKRRSGRWIYLLPLLFFLISLPRLVTLVRQYRRMRAYSEQIEVMKEENRLLREMIERFNEDPFYTEKILREDYGYIREGEYIYIMREGLNNQDR